MIVKQLSMQTNSWFSAQVEGSHLKVQGSIDINKLWSFWLRKIFHILGAFHLNQKSAKCEIVKGGAAW